MKNKLSKIVVLLLLVLLPNRNQGENIVKTPSYKLIHLVNRGGFEFIFKELSIIEKEDQENFIKQIKLILNSKVHKNVIDFSDPSNNIFDVYNLEKNGNSTEYFILLVVGNFDREILFLKKNKFIRDSVTTSAKYHEPVSNVFELDGKMFIELDESSGGSGFSWGRHSIYLWGNNNIKKCLEFEMAESDINWHMNYAAMYSGKETIFKDNNKYYLKFPVTIRYIYGICFDPINANSKDDLVYHSRGEVKKTFNLFYTFDSASEKFIFDSKKSCGLKDAEGLFKTFKDMNTFLDICYEDLASKAKNIADKEFVTCFIQTCQQFKIKDDRIKKLREIIFNAYGSFPDFK